MRAGAGLAILLLAACSQDAQPQDPDSLIECALAGAQSFTRDCSVERGSDAGSPIITVRQPDGGFRRFTVSEDGASIAAADGAQLAAVTPWSGGLEVLVGLDRYRLPAAALTDAGK